VYKIEKRTGMFERQIGSAQSEQERLEVLSIANGFIEVHQTAKFICQ